MKLIGITGKSGAGKTTFSNILSKNKDIGVIHIDDLLKELKLKYFKLLMQKDNYGEKTKISGNLKMLIYKNKILFNLFMKFRAKILKKGIDNKIKELQDDGKKIVAIDDIFIKTLHIYDKLDKVFLIERSYIKRKEALKDRDNLTVKDIVAADIAHFKGIYKDTHKNNKVEKIINDGSEELLNIKAKEIYDKFHTSHRENFRSRLIVRCEQKQNLKKDIKHNKRSIPIEK